MVILVPAKPIVAPWLWLSAMVLVGYIASSLIEAKTPFVPYHYGTHHPLHHRSAHRPA